MKEHSLPDKHFVFIGAVLLALVAVGLYVIDRGSQPQAAGQKVKVVAAENFWGNIVQQLGGDKVTVTSIITDPSADPHLYESDAHDAKAIAEADIVLKNGLGYDDFMDKLLGAASNQHRAVLSAADILGIQGDEANPHVWYAIARVPEVAKAVEAQLASKDPADATYFKHQLAVFTTSLRPLLDKLAAIKAAYPQAPVAYTERVPGYMLDAAGLVVKTPEGFASAIEKGNDPSPADQSAMTTLLSSHSVEVLLYNTQTVSAVTQHMRDLAGQAGIPVVGMSETLPVNEPTYQSWQLHQLDALKNALQ